MSRAQAARSAAIEGIGGIQQGRGRQHQSHPMEEGAELILIGPAVQRDGDPHHVHRGKAGKEQPKQKGAVEFPDRPFRAFRIVWNSRVADAGQRLDQVRQLVPAVIPAQVQAFPGQIDLGRYDTRSALQTPFYQPDAGCAVDAFHQQVNVPNFAGAGGELLLHLVEIVYLDVLRKFGRRSQQYTFRGTLVVALQAGLVDCSANRLAAETAEVARMPFQFLVKVGVRRNRQATMETTG